MDYQGRYNNRTVADFLINEVHPQMDNKYFLKTNQDVKDASGLQQFFKELKIAAEAHKNGNIVNNLAIESILYTLQQMKRTESWNYDISNLFHRSGGTTFERELSDVIIAVASNLTDEDINVASVRKNINIGGEKGNVMNENFSAFLSQEILTATGVKMEKKIKTDSGEKKLHYLADVEGKIDVDGTNYIINIKANPDATLLKYYQLLSQATFSAKNYDSLTWDDKLKMLVESNHSKIKIGDSNIVRAVYGSLNSLSLWNNDTIISAIYAGYWAINRYKRQNVATHFFHLRYIYELTGAGIIYKNGAPSKEVRFLIYNDPHGDIYVKSTAEIIGNVLNNQPMFTGNPFKDIYIKKEYFKV